MKSWRDEDLVMFHYGEHPQSDELRAALARDPDLAKRLATIVRTLDLAAAAPVAEPDAEFEARAWQRLRPALDAPAPRRSWLRPLEGVFGAPSWRVAALAATLVAVIGGAYLAGRASVQVDPDAIARTDDATPAFNDAERERLLFASVGGHLGSSSLLLTDLANAPSDAAVGDERAWAETLLAGNRLYRQAAQRAGQRRIVALLDELEPLLLELAHAPEGSTYTDLQHQLDERDLLFKLRVLGNRLQSPLPAASATAARPTGTL